MTTQTTMKVKAASGLRVPTEQNPRKYITEKEAVTIPLTPYYQRRLANKELVEQVKK